MVPDWVVFCDIICQVFLFLFPEYVEMILLYSISDPIKFHVYCSGYFCFAIPLTMLFETVFSVATGVGGCEWPVYARSILIDFHFWKFSNNPPNSASVADTITFIIMMHYTYTGPLYGCIACIRVFDFGPRKNYPPDLIFASGSDM